MTFIISFGEFGILSFCAFWLIRNECGTDPRCICFDFCNRYTYTPDWPDEEINFMEPNDLDDEAYYSESNVNYKVITEPLR